MNEFIMERALKQLTYNFAAHRIIATAIVHMRPHLEPIQKLGLLGLLRIAFQLVLAAAGRIELD